MKIWLVTNEDLKHMYSMVKENWAERKKMEIVTIDDKK